MTNKKPHRLLQLFVLFLIYFASLSDISLGEDNDELENQYWWEKSLIIAHRFPIEFYRDKTTEVAVLYKIQLMDQSIQTWIEYQPWVKYPEHWLEVEQFVQNAHAAGLKVGAFFGFHITESLDKDMNEPFGFKEIYRQLPEEEMWCYPNGTIALDPYSVGTSRTFYGLMVSLHQGTGLVLSPQNPFWLNFIIDWAKKNIDAGVDGIHLDSPEASFPIVETGGFECGNNTWHGIKFIEYLRSRFSIEELRELGIQKLDNFDFPTYLISRYDIKGVHRVTWIIRNFYNSGNEVINFANITTVMQDPIVREYLIFEYISYIDFVKAFVKSVKEYASSKGRDILISTNLYGIWIPLTFDIRSPMSVILAQLFDVVNIEHNTVLLPPLGRDSAIYKMGQSAGGFTEPVWVFEWFGWFSHPYGDRLIDNISTILKIKLAEGYACGGIRELPFAAGDIKESWPPRRLLEGYESKEISNYARFIYNNQKYFQDVNPYSRVAVIYSIPTVLWDYLPAFGLYPLEYMPELGGWTHALEEMHIPYDILIFGHPLLFNDTASLSRIKNYDLLILPNAIRLSDSHLRLLREYVEGDGKLIVTGKVGIKDENDLSRQESVLSQLLQYSNVLYLERLMGYKYQVAIEKGGDDPSTYGEIKDAVDKMLPDRYISTNTSKTVTINVLEQPRNNRIILHLVNYDYGYNESSDWVSLAANIRVRLSLPEGFQVGGISLMSPDLNMTSQLPYDLFNGSLVFTIPILRVWDIVVIQPPIEAGTTFSVIAPSGRKIITKEYIPPLPISPPSPTLTREIIQQQVAKYAPKGIMPAEARRLLR